MKLMCSPLRRVLRDRNFPGPRVDVLPTRDVRKHARIVPLSISFAHEQRRPSLACVWVTPSDAPTLTPTMPFRRATLAGLSVTPGEIPKIVDSHYAAHPSRVSIHSSTSERR